MKIAIVGTGIAGLSAAYALSRRHDITLFEADRRVGGHSHTVDMPDGFGGTVPVDTGFIVYNTPNYPNLVRLFEATGVATEESDMSFAVSIGRGKTEYFGDFRGMFAQKRNFFRPSHWQMIRDILHFYKKAPGLLEHVRAQRKTLGELLDDIGYSRAFRYRHILPMAGAIWSMPVERVNDFPAEALISFFENHQLFDMDLLGRPIWRTVTGGSREYVHKVTASFADDIKTNAAVLAAARHDAGVKLTLDGSQRSEAVFDQVVFACHADQTLSILGTDATARERAILSAVPYEENLAVLHADQDHLPKRRRAWASWNYMADREAHSDETLSPVALTYWMNRLQNLKTAEPVLVTLNPLTLPAPEKTYATITYGHPQFSREAFDAQQNLKTIQGTDRLWYCGAWCGHGFHEDGASSGFAVAAGLGAPAKWAGTFKEMSSAGANATPLGNSHLHILAAE